MHFFSEQNVCLRRLFCHLFFMCLVTYATSENCKYVNPCKCEYQNGSVIDLTRVGSTDGPRWKDVKPDKQENYVYYYNPCYEFKLEGGCADGVAACQVDHSKNLYFDIGDQNHAFFLWDSKEQVMLSYHHQGRTTNVTLVCAPESTTDTLVVHGETAPKSKIYTMTLTSRCACPDLCRDKSLSVGSVLVILLLVFVLMYLCLGIVYTHLVRGAHGWELIPHYDFWLDFPLLVRDGCLFICNGCRRETSYERI